MLMNPKVILGRVLLGALGAVGQIAVIECYKTVKSNVVQAQNNQQQLNRRNNFVMYDLKAEAM